MSQEIENNFEERKKDWDLTGLLGDVIRRYIYQLTNDELNEINLEKASGMPDEEIKNGIKLPLATMQQRRETWGSQSKLDVQEPMIFILQSTVEKLSVGDKIPLSDADSFLIHQESGVLNYELHYLMNGTPQEYNAFLDLSKVKVADTLKNVGRALTGKELLEYVPWDPEKGKIASVQRKIYAMERTLGNLQERTNTLLSKMQRPEQKPEKQVKKTTKKVI